MVLSATHLKSRQAICDIRISEMIASRFFDWSTLMSVLPSPTLHEGRVFLSCNVSTANETGNVQEARDIRVLVQ